MPRPTKRRRICGLPEGKIFVCADVCEKQAEPVVMTLEEYETMKRRMEQMEKALIRKSVQNRWQWPGQRPSAFITAPGLSWRSI